MAFNFSGKRILITGAGRGIGRALAIAVANAGGQVYGLSRQQKNLDSLVAEWPGIFPIQADLADWEATRAVVEKLPAMNGLVNNAAVINSYQPSVDLAKEDVQALFNVNVLGALNVTQIVAKRMVAAGNGGSIVNVSSMSALQPVKKLLAYSMSKAALDMMTKEFAYELGPHNIRVNSVNPTVVYTNMTGGVWDESLPRTKRLKDLTSLGRFAEVHEVVGPIMYLLSDVSSMVTGTMNPVEGGVLSHVAV